MNARDVILARLRAALADAPPPVTVPRDYETGPIDADLVQLFTDRLSDYRATVHARLAAALERIGTLLVPEDVPRDWLSGFPGKVIQDDALSNSDIDSVDAVLTGCAVAIAETGTIVLDAGAAQGRRVISLLPDRHVVVVHQDQIVGRVPEALRRLDPRRPQTWISGPSATSDIELTRVEGVHGPRHLAVVLLPARNDRI